MNLKEIIHISGKSGLYKIISKNAQLIVIENISNKKRSILNPIYQVSALEEIEIYTYKDTIALNDVLNAIEKKENYKPCISHKSKEDDLIKYFREIEPNYDEKRVYSSNIKKILQWYNLINEHIKINKKNGNTKKT